ncbi:HAD-IIIA family hydrolase, partial [Alteromonas stellipolaris]
MGSHTVKALFLDRDGIINVDHGYVGRYEDFEYVDGIFALIKRFEKAGYKIIIVTNQSGIARGLYSEDDFNALMSAVQQDFYQAGIGEVSV